MLQRLTFAADTFAAVSDRGARYRGYEELFGQQPSKGLEDVEQVGWWERGDFRGVGTAEVCGSGRWRTPMRSKVAAWRGSDKGREG